MGRMIQSTIAGLLVLASLTMTPLAAPETAVAGDATVATCNEPSFNAALAAVQSSGGGTLVIDCSDPITFTNQKVITSDVTIVGNGTVIDGGNSTRLFRVVDNARLALIGMTLRNGSSSLEGGAAIFNLGTLDIVAVTFSDNGTNFGGGAIRNDGALTVTASTFSDNRAGFGGAIVNNDTLEITASTFSNNLAGFGGGAIDNREMLTISASTFSGNTASIGAGINNDGVLTVTTSTFTTNSAGTFGGAIINGVTNGTTEVVASTIIGNSAGFGGQAIYNNVGTVTVSSSIVAGTCSGMITGAGSNLGNHFSCGFPTGTIALNSLADNGGPTETMLPMATSDAIDAASCAHSSDSDQRGVPRPIPPATTCDIGSVEVEGIVAVQIVTFTPMRSIDEGEGFELLTIAFGPDNDDLIYHYDCDADGVYETFGSSNSTSDMTACGSFIDDGLYIVEVQVCDGGNPGNCATAIATVTVLNVAPTVDTPSVSPSPSDEGQAVTASAGFSDPGIVDIHTCAIDWGDGSVEDGTVTGESVCVGDHTYADDGDYTVTIGVCDDDGGCGQNSVAHSVLNVAPTVETPVVDPAPSDEGTIVIASATFSDPGILDTHTCTVDYGEGDGPEAGTVASNTCTGAPHTYVDGDNSYTVTIEVCDDDGGCNQASTLHSVLNVAPTVDTPVVIPSPSNEGESVIASARFSDPGILDSHTCTVDYGEGDGPQAGIIEGDTCTGPAHTYLDDLPGGYQVTIEVCDNSLDCGQASTIHTVLNLPPVIEEIIVSDAELGDPITVTVIASDPGINDLLSYEFDCDGDGEYEVGPQESNSTVCPGDATRLTLVIGVRVSDGDGGVAEDSITLTFSQTYCTNPYTGQLTYRASGCLGSEQTVELTSDSAVTFCANPFTGQLSYGASGGCPAGWLSYVVPGVEPLMVCQNVYTGGLRVTPTGSCTTNERVHVIPAV